jgi:hypothetical protein
VKLLTRPKFKIFRHITEVLESLAIIASCQNRCPLPESLPAAQALLVSFFLSSLCSTLLASPPLLYTISTPNDTQLIFLQFFLAPINDFEVSKVIQLLDCRSPLSTKFSIMVCWGFTFAHKKKHCCK